MMPPIVGKMMNTHNCASAQSPTNSAGASERAGFTEVFVTGMLIRWISVSARPMASGARPAGARRSVTPWMTSRKANVSSSSMTMAAASE